MRHLLAILLTALTLSSLTISNAHAGQIWTDGNGDGLPDLTPFPVAANTVVSFGVWIDAQSFTWTNYLAYVEFTSGCLTYLGATYVITGGSNFPIDDFSHPNGVGFGGSGFNQGGVDHIGNVNVQITTPVACAVMPIIDADNPFYVFSQLGTGSAYQLFTTNSITVYGDAGGPPRGACCFPDRSCIVLDDDQCAAQGGVFMGVATACGEVSCGPPFVGACCLPDGSCQILIESDCAANGGMYAGNDVACADANCPPPTGACCFCPGGFCEELTAEECDAAGGVYVGNGIPCSSFSCSCPPPSSACCFPDGSCVDLFPPDCVGQGGVPSDLYQFCSVVQCVPANSVEPKSWGKIKSLFR